MDVKDFKEFYLRFIKLKSSLVQRLTASSIKDSLSIRKSIYIIKRQAKLFLE